MEILQYSPCYKKQNANLSCGKSLGFCQHFSITSTTDLLTVLVLSLWVPCQRWSGQATRLMKTNLSYMSTCSLVRQPKVMQYLGYWLIPYTVIYKVHILFLEGIKCYKERKKKTAVTS